ncbi:MAG TPA: SRPBCC family protein [Solirubrobacterales bacterium]|nr:SRPBCC family protein [Solirubrobacterales bacterium]
MRIDEQIEVAVPPADVWRYLEDPENYLRFMAGLTHWEGVGDRANGPGARYRILLQVGAAEVGGLIEMVEWHEPFDIAWHSVTGVDNRGRWRLRSLPEGRTRIEFRWAYAFPGSGLPGLVTELAASLPVRRQMRRTLRQLKQGLEELSARSPAGPAG